MKQFFTHSLGLFLLTFTINLQAQTFVNHAASGNNDGTSWADAYTSLHDALTTATDEIWVATGTYATGDATADSTAVFMINTAISLYGGFAGTETMLSERDLANNPTTLTADLLGDDLDGDFSTNRTDNSRHVLAVAEGIADLVTIDGFFIQSGNTSPFGDTEPYYRSGGGVHAMSRIRLESCSFSNNFGRTGAGVYLGGDASESSIGNCAFSDNLTNSQSAGIFVDSLFNVQITYCDFSNNTTVRGAIYTLRGGNNTIDNCDFNGNVNENGFGGALFNWNGTNLTITNCDFDGNFANNAGVFYNDGRELAGVADQNILIDNCAFTGNFCGATAGVFYSWQGSGIVVSNTDFSDNIGGDGGAIYYSAGDVESMNPLDFQVTNCEFSGNAATDFGGGSIYVVSGSMTLSDNVFSNTNIPGSGGFCFFTGANKIINLNDNSFSNATISGWGGAHTCYGENSIFNISYCTYTGNTSSNLGGAVHAGFTAITNFNNCTFETNSAASGGALSAQNDSTEIHVVNSNFASNMATNNGGAIFAGTNASSSILSANGCEFQANTANFGAAIHISELGDDDISRLDVYNSLFIFNVADAQGGAINNSNADMTMINNVFSNNIAVDPGVGGAISNNASSNNDVEISIINSTFADNSGAFAAGIAQWMENDSGSLVLHLQNNIFQNAGANYVIENGMPTVISNGGNLNENADMSAILIQSSDILGANPAFIDASNFDYHLTEDSPCVGAGITDGAPEIDIEGNLRGATVDIGAFEYDIVQSLDGELVQNQGALKIFPNPVATHLQLTLKNDWTDDLTLQIFNLQGQTIQTLTVQKFNQTLALTVPVSELATGAYFVTISNGDLVVMERMMKR